MPQIRRSGPPPQEAAPKNTECAQSNRQADTELDLTLLGGPNADIWAALFDGTFRLARRCDVCGRWLTAHASKAAGRGPNCAARAVTK